MCICKAALGLGLDGYPQSLRRDQFVPASNFLQSSYRGIFLATVMCDLSSSNLYTDLYFSKPITRLLLKVLFKYNLFTLALVNYLCRALQLEHGGIIVRLAGCCLGGSDEVTQSFSHIFDCVDQDHL